MKADATCPRQTAVPALSMVGRLVALIRKFKRSSARRQCRRTLLDDLQRLAETSPHLLADIGYGLPEERGGLARPVPPAGWPSAASLTGTAGLREIIRGLPERGRGKDLFSRPPAL